MVDRRRWPTAAYFHSWNPQFHGTHHLSLYRKNIPDKVDEIAYEQDVARNTGHLLTVGDRIRELYWSALQYEDNDESFWHFDRLLGFGSFGLVASYEKRNFDGQVLDTLVAKSEPARSDLAVSAYRVDVGREAYHLAQLNERSSDRIIGLRGYKYLTGHSSVLNGAPFALRAGEYFPEPLYREWRSFLELCELGNLYGMILKYKAWGYYLPEAFIWWTFLQLIEACSSMGTNAYNPFRHEEADSFGAFITDSFMLHNDMKEENIFVKPQPENAEWELPYNTYPFIQLADFGLSQVTTITAPGNRADKIKPGTESYVAPEKRVLETISPFYPFTDHLSRDVLRDPNGVPFNKRQHPVGPEANVWGVGAIIYLLMTLRDGEELSRIVDQKLDFSDPSKTFPEGDLEVLDIEDFGSGPVSDRSWDYSNELKKAVMMCLRIQPSRRPEPATMIPHLKHYMDVEARRLRAEFNGDPHAILENTRLNVSHDDWNQTPAGPFWQDFYISLTPPVNRPADAPWLDYFWTEFWKYCDKFAHPNEARLVPPAACRQIDVGPNYQGRDYIGTAYNGHEDNVVYYPWQYNSPPYAYHSRAFFPPGGRAVRSRSDYVEQQSGMARQLGSLQQEIPDQVNVEQLTAYHPAIDEVSAQATARCHAADQVRAQQQQEPAQQQQSRHMAEESDLPPEMQRLVEAQHAQLVEAAQQRIQQGYGQRQGQMMWTPDMHP